MSRQRAALGRRPFAAGMRFGRLRALGLLAGSSLLGVAGCGFDAYTTADAPQNACTLVEDCLAGTCVDGLCVEPAPEALRVFVEVEPLENADRTLPHRWRFTPEVVVGPGVQDLTLPPGVEAERWPAAISVGTNPTFDGQERRVESYVLDRDDLELYDAPIAVDFVGRIRGQVRFTGVEGLIVQMNDDVDRTRELLAESSLAD